MTFFRKLLSTLTPVYLAAVVMLTLDSCSTSHGIRGIPENLPPVAVSGSTNTPPHHMASYEYPFDSNGRYVTDWAAEGERKAGRSAAATSSDTNKWSSARSGVVITKARPPSRGGSSSSTYIVKSGDTLSGLAARYHTTVTKIKSANGLSSNLIRIGQKLRIPR